MLIESNISKKALTNQLDKMVGAGYAELLQMSVSEYEAQLSNIIERSDPETNTDELLTLVEPRIPFTSQLRALELREDPAVYYNPSNSTHRPYVAKLQLIHLFDGNNGKETYRETIKHLPQDLRAASPFEGLLISDQILAESFAVLAGGRFDKVSGITGDFQTLNRYHCLERFLGKPRISYVNPDSYDYFVAVGVARRGHLNQYFGKNGTS